jgi:translation initiation factor IF-3
MSRSKTKYRKNRQIRSDKVRLVDDDGEQIGVVEIEKAREKAKEKNLDLVEVAPKAKPPVVKLVDYSKFIYEQEKKQSEAKKKSKKGELKEIRLSPFIGEADLKTRLRRAEEFREENDKLRFVVQFKGRQITQKKFGYKLLDKVKAELEEIYEQDGKIKQQGKRLIMYMKPRK